MPLRNKDRTDSVKTSLVINIIIDLKDEQFIVLPAKSAKNENIDSYRHS